MRTSRHPRRTPATIGLAVILTAALAGCSPTLAVKSQAMPWANLSSYRTYEWAAQPATALRQTGDESAVLDWRIRAAIDDGLAARGYRRAAGNPPDVLVAYDVVVREKNTDSFRGYFGYLSQGGRKGLGDAFVEGYDEGTLVIELVDQRTRDVAWRGSASGVIDPAHPGRRVDQAVGEILARLPPAAA